jgi:hypothetical protein
LSVLDQDERRIRSKPTLWNLAKQTVGQGSRVTKKVSREKKAPRLASSTLAELIEEITVNACGQQEQLWAFRQAFEDNISLPLEGSVVGEPVVVVGFDHDGNERRGLTAKCRGADGRKYVVSTADVVTAPESGASRYLAAYRKWMGLTPYPRESSSAPNNGRPGGGRTPDAIGSIGLVVLSLKQNAARCRLLGSGGEITLRATRLWDVVPGEIAMVRAHKRWTYAGNPYLSGKIESRRLDVGALDLAPLKLEARGVRDPAQEYRGDEGEPIDG